MAYAWTCPTCGRHATIQQHDFTYGTQAFSPTLAGDRRIGIVYWYTHCPNPKCGSYELTVRHHDVEMDGNGRWKAAGEEHSKWRFFPRSNAQVFPDYIPAAIKQDYEEACLIVDLSPKASATLSRRCLQGVLRDFWKVKPSNLANEIAEIKDKCDPLTWLAIEAVRKVGNIGAHMEKDVDTIVDVEPGEGQLLIGLIETVVKDWYIARAERERQMNALVALAAAKEAARKS